MGQLSVAERARKIKEEASLDMKIEIAKDLLINTNLVKSETALCQFEDNIWHNEENYFKLSIVFFRSGVFGAVPARTVARKHSKYKAFLYIGL